MRSWRSPAERWLVVFWRLFQLLTGAAVCWVAWRLFGRAIYHIDVEVYRMGAQAWLSGRPLYSGGATFHTASGLDLPFTYPPLSAIVFSPFAWLSVGVSGIVMTLITIVLLVVSTVIVLTGLNVWPTSVAVPGPAWVRRGWLAAAIVAAAVIYLEPIQSNLAFGQINVVLMTLVLADCVPQRTRWPRGLLLGLAIALKLTPAAFLLYFALRRDGRAALTATVSFVAATVGGFMLAWRDSLEYWTSTVRNTDRIGSAALNTNQNVAGMLARLELTRAEQLLLWTLVCLLILAVTVWAGQRVLRAGEPVLAVMCVALFGLLVSPVSWSHHWVWVLPAVLTAGVLAIRRRSLTLAAVTTTGVALMVWTPIELMPKHHEATATWWRQLVGVSYVWWALAVIVVAGATVVAQLAQRTRADVAETAPGATTVPAIG